jgi:hypothetical protein
MLKSGTAVHCASGPVEVGARIIDLNTRTTYWINICVLGQHLPQVYREKELTVMHTAEDAQKVGLCGSCLGFGTTFELSNPMYPAGIDELDNLCITCRGTGREWVRSTVERSAGSVIGNLTILPHEYRGLDNPEALCFRCSVEHKDHSKIGRQDGTGVPSN